MPTTVPPFGWDVPVLGDPPNVPAWLDSLARDIGATVQPLAVPATSTAVSWGSGFAQGSVAPLLYKIGRLVIAQLSVRRTGADIVGSSSTGNIGNVTMATVSTASYRPVAGTEGMLKTGSVGPLAGGAATSAGSLNATAFSPGGRWSTNETWTWHGLWVSAS